MNENASKFETILAEQYADLYEHDPEYAYSKAHISAGDLARKMTAGLRTGSANKDGAGIRRTCRVLGLPHTYKAIRAYLG